jgi:hypothetical protein
MPHVTFIHGIANKPPRDELARAWEAAIAAGGLDLGANGVTTSLVYWADVVYASPLPQGVRFESVDDGLGTEEIDEDLRWMSELSAEEKRVMLALEERMGLTEEEPPPTAEARPEIAVGAAAFEAVPLPWFIKRRLMKRFLKDVHHYLFDASFSPRPGVSYRVRRQIRKLFIEQMKIDEKTKGQDRHVVVAHSMGTVIAYDCLKNVADCPAIDGLLTIGSPLGISEIHDNFEPRYDKKNSFPSEKLQGDWWNFHDRLDPVAIDARLANDYQQEGSEVIKDQQVKNEGLWRHDSEKYLAQSSFGEALRNILEL